MVAAWWSGDGDSLSLKNRYILDYASAVIREYISDDMSDYEKELAIHDYLVSSVAYDAESGDPDPDNGNPYGALVRCRAVDTGYSSTFQLLMDMLGIPCRTIYGQVDWSANLYHTQSWNLVRLDGKWYFLDVCRDAAAPEATIDAAHRYFNLTADQFWAMTYRWNGDGLPAATGTDYRWIPSESSRK